MLTLIEETNIRGQIVALKNTQVVGWFWEPNLRYNPPTEKKQDCKMVQAKFNVDEKEGYQEASIVN